MADMIDEQARNIEALSSVEGWDSDAGRAFNEVADGASGRLKKAFERYDEAAKALGTKVREGEETKEFASELHRAQHKADTGLSSYRDARADYDEAEREIKRYTDKYDGKKPPEDELADYRRWVHQKDEATKKMHKAADEISDARDIFDDAGDRAAKHIKNVVHHDGVHDPGGFMNWLADWADKFSNISAILSVLAVICAFVTLAVISSALALAGHIYDMTARGGKLDLLKLGVDVLGVLPGLGALKGFKAFKGMAKLTRMGRLGARGRNALSGVGHNFMNGVSVKLTNKILSKGAKLLGKEFKAVDGKIITGLVKGGGFVNLMHKFLGDSGGNHGESASTPTPTPQPTPTPPTTSSPTKPSTPTPAPQVSPKPFHAALAA
jgi:hypothetical protein